jgi:hypothetical protein
MQIKPSLPVLLILLAAVPACAVGTPTAAGPDAIGSAVAATLAGGTAPAARPSDTAAPPTAETPLPTAEPSAAPETPAPACLPVHPGPQNLPRPAAVAAAQGETIRLKNLQAQELAARTAPGFTFPRSEQAHLAGNLGEGAANLPFLYFSLQNGGELRTNIAETVSTKWAAPDFLAMAGAEGRPAFAYVTLDMFNQSLNRLYSADLASAGAPDPVLTWSPPAGGHTGNAIRPLAVRYGFAAEGIWFTYSLYGIGDVLYPPDNGLAYFNLATQETVEFLSPQNALGGISPDQTMVAYGAGQGGTPGVIRNGVTVRNLRTCAETYIPFNPASNLGGGWMEFSPDNQLLAWTEAGGPDNFSATFRLRVARSDGASLFDAPVASLTSLLGGEAPGSLKPVGWFADHLLLLEAYAEAVHGYVLVVWAPDPARPLDPVLGANQSVPVADGQFIGFVYP